MPAEGSPATPSLPPAVSQRHMTPGWVPTREPRANAQPPSQPSAGTVQPRDTPVPARPPAQPAQPTACAQAPACTPQPCRSTLDSGAHGAVATPLGPHVCTFSGRRALGGGALTAKAQAHQDKGPQQHRHPRAICAARLPWQHRRGLCFAGSLCKVCRMMATCRCVTATSHRLQEACLQTQAPCALALLLLDADTHRQPHTTMRRLTKAQEKSILSHGTMSMWCHLHRTSMRRVPCGVGARRGTHHRDCCTRWSRRPYMLCTAPRERIGARQRSRHGEGGAPAAHTPHPRDVLQPARYVHAAMTAHGNTCFRYRSGLARGPRRTAASGRNDGARPPAAVLAA